MRSRRQHRALRAWSAAAAVGVLAATATVLAAGVVSASAASSTCGSADAAKGRPAYATSVENASFPASDAVDGDNSTRWSSAFSDPQRLRVDLGSTKALCQVVLHWEAAYAKSFVVQASLDGKTWTTLYATTSGTGGNQSISVSGRGRYVRMAGRVRGTPYGYSLWELIVHTTSGTTPTPAPTTSTPPAGSSWGGFPSSFWADPGTIPAAHNVLELQILNRTNGQYPDSEVYYSFDGQMYNVASNPYFDMPANSSGRMYFYLGSPSSAYSDFIEFTVGSAQFNGNTTRVDAWALPLVMHLHDHDGSDQTVGDDPLIFSEGRTATFDRFASTVPTQFRALAQAPYAPYRIIAPGSLPAFQPGGANQDYLSGYAGQNGIAATTQEVFGCSGPLANDPVDCAALNRHVAGQPAAVQDDPSQFYRNAPANYYAKFWHDNAINNKAYGFPYDDVHAQSTYVSHANPQYLLVAIGF